jgi:predicted HAD superfamily phosphohydrolase YqeG
MRPAYAPVAGLREAVRLAWRLSARTVIFDVEPLVAHWDSGQEALDRGIAMVLGEVAPVPGVQVVCFATNSLRRPSIAPGATGATGARVVYRAAAGKPLRIAPYLAFPRPGVVIGDQLATDGVLARRLGYTFALYVPPAGGPAGPRLMGACGRLVRPLLFTRTG